MGKPFDSYKNNLFPRLIPIFLLLSFGCARKSFYSETPVTDPAVYRQLQQASANIDSVTVQAGSHYRRGFLYTALWGQRHRHAWTAPVTVPVLRLDSAKGGLEVEKIGGGLQTTSATMVGGDGMTYALRTVDKRPEVNLPSLLRRTFLADLTRDQTSSLHPYAALVVAPLARAAGVPHATPTLVYVRPDEELLGEHKELLSDRLYMLEEKFNDNRALVGDLAEAANIVGSEKMLALRDSQSHHFIDQLAFAKARLLDLLIGDRDRHEGQWEWAVYKQDAGYIYRPIPKDRDNAFFRFDDGLFTWLLSRKWGLRKFVTFHGEFRDVKGLMIKSEFIDARALPEVTAQQVDSLARELQQAITDEVIREAVRKLPEAVYRQQGEELAQMLRNRRDNLGEAAREFYKILAKEVQVRGTEEEDIFEVVRLNDEETEVTVRRKPDGKVTYHRIFYRAETDEVVLHGLAGNDEFEVRGQVRKGIKVSILGGQGQDNIRDSSSVNGQGRKTIVYDTNSGDEPDPGPEAKKRNPKK